MLLIVKNELARLKRKLRGIGYSLAATSEALPSILAYTEEEWESRRRSGSPFRRNVERDAVPVLRIVVSSWPSGCAPSSHYAPAERMEELLSGRSGAVRSN